MLHTLNISTGLSNTMPSFDTIRQSDEASTMELDVTVSGESGDIDIDVNIDAPTRLPEGIEGAALQPSDTILVEGSAIARPGGTTLRVAQLDLDISPSRSELTSFRNTLEDIPNRISDQIGVDPDMIRAQLQFIRPDIVDQQFSGPVRDRLSNQIRGQVEETRQQVTDQAQVFRSTIQENLGLDRDITELPVTFDFDVQFPPFVVPEQALDQLPSIPVTISVTSDAFFSRFLELPSVTVELPPEAFAETVTDIDFCADPRGQIAELEELTRDAVNRARNSLNELQDVQQEIGNRVANVDVSATQFRNRVTEFRNNIRSQQQLSQFRDRIEEWQNRVDEVSVNPLPDGQSIRDILQNRIPDIDIPTPCLDELRSRLESLRNRLQEARDLSTQVSNLRSRLNDRLNIIRSRIEGLDGIPDCVDTSVTPSSLQNSIESFRSDAERFEQVRSFRTENRFRNLLDQSDQLRDRVQQEVDRSECVQQWLEQIDTARSRVQQVGTQGIQCSDEYARLSSDVNSFISNAREFERVREIERTQDRFRELVNRGESLQSRIRREVEEQECIQQFQNRVDGALSDIGQTGPRRESIVPCGQQYSSIDDQVDEFENLISQLSVPVGPQRQQEVASQGLQLIDQIQQNVEPGRCREDFVTRVRGATNRVRSLTERVRVTRVEEAQDQAQETLQQLLDQIQQIQVRRGSGRVQNRDSIL